MKNTALKFSLGLGLLIVSGSQLSAGKTWKNIQKGKEPGFIVTKMKARIDTLEELQREAKAAQNESEYLNFKVALWKARDEKLDEKLNLILEKQAAKMGLSRFLSDAFKKINEDEQVSGLKASASSLKDRHREHMAKVAIQVSKPDPSDEEELEKAFNKFHIENVEIEIDYLLAKLTRLSESGDLKKVANLASFRDALDKLMKSDN